MRIIKKAWKLVKHCGPKNKIISKMSNLPAVIFFVLYPVAHSLTNYLTTLRYRHNGWGEVISKEDSKTYSMLSTLVWIIGTAYLLLDQ